MCGFSAKVTSTFLVYYIKNEEIIGIKRFAMVITLACPLKLARTVVSSFEFKKIVLKYLQTDYFNLFAN